MSTRKSGMFIAIAVITLELIGGMQSYLSQLILPILAKDLNSQNLYGVILGISSIATMAGLPIGAAAITRVQLSKLLVSATLVLVFGALMSALAPNIFIFMIGSALRGVAGSILAMTSVGAVALGLSGRARQLTLAFASASWVIASIVGPAYAAWVTHLLSWRWAMLLYLPLLLVARFAITFSLKSEDNTKDTPISYEALALIIFGVTATIFPLRGIAKVVLLLVGIAFLGRVAILLMPTHTFSQRTPRRAALAGMFFLTGSYFSANELVSLTAHDIYHADAESLGYILTGGGLAWALLGVFCGMRPTKSLATYRTRSTIGLALLIASTLAISLLTLNEWRLSYPTLYFVALWTVTGIGMGLTYLDTLNIFFEDPDIPDGITIEEMASSSVIVESLSSTMFVPLTSSIVAMAFTNKQLTSSIPYGASWLIVLGLAAAALYYLRRVQPANLE
ncbi:MFS transporter [Cutibacterium sp. WCA-380-WT-3A]|uniref:MFS transporter n=1 Tax=Cutibacterium porci TaxID=2605781 RepID=A0A7K0J8C8_9ACTN|nr:MFS transporter [Cutibacterium porci]MSS46214.1 MFS transporter [Cutibacterium porci]